MPLPLPAAVTRNLRHVARALLVVLAVVGLAALAGAPWAALAAGTPPSGEPAAVSRADGVTAGAAAPAAPARLLVVEAREGEGEGEGEGEPAGADLDAAPPPAPRAVRSAPHAPAIPLLESGAQGARLRATNRSADTRSLRSARVRALPSRGPPA